MILKILNVLSKHIVYVYKLKMVIVFMNYFVTGMGVSFSTLKELRPGQKAYKHKLIFSSHRSSEVLRISKSKTMIRIKLKPFGSFCTIKMLIQEKRGGEWSENVNTFIFCPYLHQMVHESEETISSPVMLQISISLSIYNRSTNVTKGIVKISCD
jgi:hypothetical protein